jgi:diguanylate cyclase (GGDEF)-like protein
LVRPSVLTFVPLVRAQHASLRLATVCGVAVLAVAWAVHALLVAGGALSAGGAAHRLADVSYVLVGFVAAALVAARAWLVRDERAAWWLLAAGTASWALGNAAWDLLYRDAADPPFPSVSDAFWFGAYLPTYAGVALLIRGRLRQIPSAVALDGLVGVLGAAALVVALAGPGIEGDTGSSWVMVVVTIAYVLADLMLIAFCVAATVLARGRLGRAWGALLSGLALKTAADGGFIALAATWPDGGALSIPWGLGLACVALAAWQPLGRPIEAVARGGAHVIPALACAAAVGVLAYGAAVAEALPPAAVLLAAATIVLTGVRIGFVVRDVQVLADSRRLAESDELTGLLNRRGFTHRLERALRDVRHGSSELALLLIDLNRFKEVNDTLGHQAGDLLLVQVADRLEATVPDAQLARIGGDEFVAVLRCGAERAVQVAERLREAIDQPVELDGLTTHTQASIGIAISPHHGGRRSDLLRHADAAMYRAKNRGTGVELYAAESDHNSRERLELAAELRAALADPEQLVLHFQPQVDLDSGRVVSLEALVRWQHPRHGLLTPDRFLALAEEHALMHPLTLAVVDRALRQQRAWRRAGLDLVVSVNVSAADLLDSGFPDEVADCLRTHGTPEGALRLELTESTVMREEGRALDTLARLSEIGVSLSLDDFGTGYSSLAHLKRLPVHELKIDRSFVLDMLTDRDDAVIVRSMVELGRSLGLRVVAEGVETPEHLEQLRYFGCHVAQGYVFSAALPASRLAGWLREHRPPARSSRPGPARSVAPSEPPVSSAVLALAAQVMDGVPLPDVLDSLSARLGELVPHDDLVLYGLDEDSSTLAALHASGRWIPETKRERFPSHEGITGAALHEGRARNVARTDLDPDGVQVAGTDIELEALMCCPLLDGRRPLGVLNVYRLGAWVPFSSEEAAVIERFAIVVALALRSAQTSLRSRSR